MSKRAIKKSLKKSFQKSAEYSAVLVFGVLFLVSSMYSLPNFSATKSVNTTNDSKNLKTTNTTKLDSSYKRYCNSDDHENGCNYIAINDNALTTTPFTAINYSNYNNQTYIDGVKTILSIRAPPTTA